MTSYRDRITLLQKAAASSPEYADIVPFFIALFTFLEKRGGESGISFRVRENVTAASIAHGLPLLSSSSLLVDNVACTTFLLEVSELLGKIGRDGSKELIQLRESLGSGKLDPPRLFAAILERRRQPVEEAAQDTNIAAPLLEYIFEIPLKAALEEFAASVETDIFADWKESFCPVCGSRAGMAELAGEEGKRFLCCATCTFSWPFRRLQCPFCGCDDGENLSYFTVAAGATRVDTCKACSRYIKTRDNRKGDNEKPLEIEDLLTIHLDLLAVKEGFERGK